MIKTLERKITKKPLINLSISCDLFRKDKISAGYKACFYQNTCECPAYVGNGWTCQRSGCGHSFGDHYN